MQRRNCDGRPVQVRGKAWPAREDQSAAPFEITNWIGRPQVFVGWRPDVGGVKCPFTGNCRKWPKKVVIVGLTSTGYVWRNKFQGFLSAQHHLKGRLSDYQCLGVYYILAWAETLRSIERVEIEDLQKGCRVTTCNWLSCVQKNDLNHEIS